MDVDQVQPVEIMIEVNKPKSRYSNINLTAIIERLNRLRDEELKFLCHSKIVCDFSG